MKLVEQQLVHVFDLVAEKQQHSGIPFLDDLEQRTSISNFEHANSSLFIPTSLRL
jgi:hypothetical protein